MITVLVANEDGVDGPRIDLLRRQVLAEAGQAETGFKEEGCTPDSQKVSVPGATTCQGTEEEQGKPFARCRCDGIKRQPGGSIDRAVRGEIGRVPYHEMRNPMTERSGIDLRRRVE